MASRSEYRQPAGTRRSAFHHSTCKPPPPRDLLEPLGGGPGLLPRALLHAGEVLRAQLGAPRAPLDAVLEVLLERLEHEQRGPRRHEPEAPPDREQRRRTSRPARPIARRRAPAPTRSPTGPAARPRAPRRDLQDALLGTRGRRSRSWSRDRSASPPTSRPSTSNRPRSGRRARRSSPPPSLSARSSRMRGLTTAATAAGAPSATSRGAPRRPSPRGGGRPAASSSVTSQTGHVPARGRGHRRACRGRR